eukprot:maker-scaffold1548_size36124-snap-gene-0.4 protein:Tk07467 transcript:maker-scaffold1548_size36124-snap-gene-0.4-mRNA-1 annotation:"hypothetical protein DAPPUDRAFT_97956"
MVIEIWKAFFSSDGKNGGRNPIDQIVFPATPDAGLSEPATTRSQAAGVVLPPLRKPVNTFATHAATMKTMFFCGLDFIQLRILVQHSTRLALLVAVRGWHLSLALDLKPKSLLAPRHMVLSDTLASLASCLMDLEGFRSNFFLVFEMRFLVWIEQGLPPLVLLNDGCTTQSDGNTQGTCLSSSECTARGGSADGNCAAGFGVCCAFILTGCSVGPVNQNCTYIRNSGFPSADTTSPLNCKYTFKRISDGLCQIRLDFKTLNLALDSTDIGLCGNAGDSLQVRSPFSSFGAAFPPTVCGNLNGQHMYFETGTTGDAGTLEINTGSGVGDRRYDIKVTYIECCTIN